MQQYHYVFGLEISMHNLKRMQKPDPTYKLLYDFCGLKLFQILLLLNEFKEIDALNEFCNDVDVGLGLDALLEFKQQRMRYDLHNAALMAESYQLYPISALA